MLWQLVTLLVINHESSVLQDVVASHPHLSPLSCLLEFLLYLGADIYICGFNVLVMDVLLDFIVWLSLSSIGLDEDVFVVHLLVIVVWHYEKCLAN